MANESDRDNTRVQTTETVVLTHGAKVKRGQLNAVRQGRYGTGPAPFGYRRGNEGEPTLVIEPEEAEIVRLMFREYLFQRSTGRVVTMLNAKGITTRKGKKWSRQAIAIILDNRTYRGRVSYGPIEAQGHHEPIIEPTVFYKTVALKNKRSRTRRRQEAEMAAKAAAQTGPSEDARGDS